MSASFERERQIAELAVQRAVLLTKTVLASMDKGAVSKADYTPVTLADFGGQALLVAAIHHAFPDDLIIGEESADALRANKEAAAKVWDLVSSTRLDDEQSESLLYAPKSIDEMLSLIDIGGKATQSGTGRVWTLDPIDGTLTFLKGTHYAVSLVLLEDGQQKVAVTGCPHVTLEKNSISESEFDRQGTGYLVSAVKGHGIHIRSLSSGSLSAARRVEKLKGPKQLSDLLITASTSGSGPVPNVSIAINKNLGTTNPLVDIYSAQLKYVALALGFCDVMLRVKRSFPAGAAYIWDHAGGMLLFEEVGGKVTDLSGKPIDLTAGRQTSRNYGLVAAPADIHSAVLKAVYEAVKNDPVFSGILPPLCE